MVLEYISTFSVKSYKHDSTAFGAYYYDTGYGICFIDRIWDLLKQSWEQEIHYHIQQHRWLEVPDYEPPCKDKVEMNLIVTIITTDFHEFLHHFLSIHNIENDCCENDKINPGTCWLCKFTNMLDVNLSEINLPIPVLKEHPELLAYQFID